MGRVDRRDKLALDESYRYYKMLEKEGETPELYRLVKCFKTMTYALSGDENGDFKLTRQLWRRVHQALFDKLITSFSGYVLVSDEQDQTIMPHNELPDEGIVEFHPDGCKRADDVFRMEIKHLYPGTQICLAKTWKSRGAKITPDDFAHVECGAGGCLLRPVVLGEEVLGKESHAGRECAYHDWWQLYWQAYCAHDQHEKHIIYKRMDEIELVWGSLYY